MPIYEYVCRGCAHPFEELILGGETARCPRCASEDLERAFSTFAVPASSGALHERTLSPAPPPGCGTCGDPRGPGACALD